MILLSKGTADNHHRMLGVHEPDEAALAHLEQVSRLQHMSGLAAGHRLGISPLGDTLNRSLGQQPFDLGFAGSQARCQHQVVNPDLIPSSHSLTAEF
jgi:hypothetical protein